jgi:hypothetical protein
MAGRSIVSAAAFKTWSASFRKSMPLASTCSCTSTASNTTTPGGKATFQMLGVLPEFERSIIQERVRAGTAQGR